MKLLKTKPRTPNLRTLAAGLAVALAGGYTAQAHPFASGITPKDPNGFVFFTMNEGGASVTVTFEDNSTLDMGVLPKGQTNFVLGAHTSYKITCTKQGTGVPTLISDDTFTNSVWSNACGMAINKDPRNGARFGTIYAGVYASYTGTGAKQQGIYAMKADQTLTTSWLGNPTGYVWSQNSLGNVSSNFKGPGRMRVAPDGSLLVADGLGAGNANMVYMFTPDLSAVQPLLGPSTATVFGDVFGTPCAVGSLAQGNLQLYIPSAGTPTPADTNCIYGPLTFQGSFNCIQVYNIGSGPLPWTKRPDYSYTVGLDGISTLRPEVDVEPNGNVVCGFGRANLSNPNIQILRPILTTNGITGDAQNKVIADAAKSATNWLYTSGVNPPFNQPPAADPWNGSSSGAGASGTYGGVRVSPDQQFLASIDNNNGITYALLDGNGLPVDATISGIVNGSSSGFQSGIDWDAADNLWTITRSGLPSNTGQSKLRCYSLGMSTTCISSNDWTGTNGTFSLVVPGAKASLLTTTPTATQNYINNLVNPGAPIPGVFTIQVYNGDPQATAGPTTVTFTRGGTAVYGVNYTINTNETPSGAIIGSDSVIFPAGIPANTSMSVGVKIIPTATPVSGPTLTVTARLNSGTNFTAIAPLNGTIAILNTGPQLLQLSAPSPSTLNGMNRGIANDYARFTITRLGDTNGPGNDSLAVVPKTYTITNFNFGAPATGPAFMANFGTDYTAGPQNFTGTTLGDGFPGVTIAPGVTTVSAAIGNPVIHMDTSLRRTNLSVVINLTNVCNTGTSTGCNTNCASAEGYSYQVTTGTQTLNEFDNANGGEVVLWSNPLTNALDSTNWTLVYAAVNQDCSPALPTVIGNYDNSATGPGLGGSGDDRYVAWFGKPLNDGNDYGITVPPSQTMQANGWNSALKVAVNKNPGAAAEAGVNLYPQVPGMPWSNHMVFSGNYALRFDMYLSLYDYAPNNPTIGTVAREFAAFGINHQGTNANWRLDINPRAAGTGSYPINADGEWCTIGAGSGSVTPADYDMFISPAWALVDTNGAALPQPVPFTTNFLTIAPFTNPYAQCFGAGYNGMTNVFANAGVPNDQQSANNAALPGSPSPQQGVIKTPPFLGINSRGGAPDNAWVDVSLEVTRQTNLTLKVAQQAIFNSSITAPIFGTVNPLAPLSGTPMLGYLDPHIDVSDYSAFVYFSNMRVVELSPFIPWTNQPVAGLIVTQGASFTLTSGAMYASNPLTNTWYRGTTNGPGPLGDLNNGTPTFAMATNLFSATNGMGSLTVNNLQSGTNYIATWSDQAGSVTGFVSVVEVVKPPSNVFFAPGSTVSLGVTFTGNAPPTSYHWMFYGTNIANGSHYSGATSATLSILNATADDSGVYSNVVANAYGNVVVSATAMAVGAVTPAVQTNLWGSTAQFTVTDPGTGTTYKWKKNNANLTEGGHITGSTTTTLTLSPVTTADAGTYTVGETNGTFGGVIGSGILRVLVVPPTITNTLVAGGNVHLFFSSTNSYDTTNAFTLQTSPLVQGPYTNVPGVTINGGSGAFDLNVPQTGEPSRFYRLQHAN